MRTSVFQYPTKVFQHTRRIVPIRNENINSDAMRKYHSGNQFFPLVNPGWKWKKKSKIIFTKVTVRGLHLRKWFLKNPKYWTEWMLFSGGIVNNYLIFAIQLKLKLNCRMTREKNKFYQYVAQTSPAPVGLEIEWGWRRISVWYLWKSIWIWFRYCCKQSWASASHSDQRNESQLKSICTRWCMANLFSPLKLSSQQH